MPVLYGQLAPMGSRSFATAQWLVLKDDDIAMVIYLACSVLPVYSGVHVATVNPSRIFDCCERSLEMSGIEL